ncbi:MAG: deoxyribose-phosphate aldolase [Collinsella sp.]|nr:deoxyribose-phosphate aldolase [Collinsella sp.]
MSHVLILLAGYPATGKSHLLNQIQDRHPGRFDAIALDDVKEEVWDEFGFSSLQEKTELEREIYARYFARLERSMECGRSLISDYVFSEKQRAPIESLARRYGYPVLTVRLVGDPHVIYDRSLARDLSDSRHIGHLLNHYHKGDVLEDRGDAEALVTQEVFLDRCSTKGYQHFRIGSLLEVDATDVSSIDYRALLDLIDTFVDDPGEFDQKVDLAKRCEEDRSQLASHIDFTLLKPTARWRDIERLCEQALAAGTASVCIPPSYVSRAHRAFPGLAICTVIGFPLGYSTSEVKAFEARRAVCEGASEVDMVIDLGLVKDGDMDGVTQDICTVRAAVPGSVLKVIVETCYLTDEEKEAVCRCVTESGADFIKTSTGFGTGGATIADIEVFSKHIGDGVRMKASGGIRTNTALKAFVAAGCDRAGCSASLDSLLG